jgi:hypothetical protein
LKFPSWKEFIEKESRFEQEVNNAISARLSDFPSKHPLIASAFHTSLHLLPSPFDSIVESVYNKSEGSDQQKLNEVREFLNKILTQGEDHYNRTASQIANNIADLKDIVAKETTLLEIKDIIVSKDDNINQKLDAIIKVQKSSMEKYLDDHSREIVRIIYQNWMADSGLFASYGYENGIKHENEPHEPQTTNSGLARQHLISGYVNHAWKFYTAGKAESVDKSKEIKYIVDSYEKLLYHEIEREIQTANGTRQLERKNMGEFFTRESGFDAYPRRFDFKSLYLHPQIAWQVFQETNNRNNMNENRIFSVKQVSDYTYLVIRSTDPASYEEELLAAGDAEMMYELKRRIEMLVDDSQIRQHVMDYHSKIAELEGNSNIAQYEAERDRIWWNVDNEGRRLSGSCDRCSNEYLDSHF